MGVRTFPDTAAARKKYPHGTYARYRLGKCRCNPCRKAVRDYVREHAARSCPAFEIRYSPSGQHYVVRNKTTGAIVARPTSKDQALRIAAEYNAGPVSPNALVDTRPICEHVARLRDLGIGLRSIAKVSGVSRSVLTRIVNGDILRTRQSTVDRILTVTQNAVQGGTRVRADACVLLIQRLIDAGFSRAWIKQQLGVTKSIPGTTYAYATAATVERIYALYEKAAAQCPTLPALTAATLDAEPIRVPAPRTLVGDIERPHGSTSCYEGGCRCDACTEWHNAVDAAQKTQTRVRFVIRRQGGSWIVRDLLRNVVVMRSAVRDTALESRDVLNVNDDGRTTPPFTLVDAAPARAHIEMLRARGLSDREIGDAAGLKTSAVCGVRAPERRRVCFATARAILAVGTDAPTRGYVYVEARVTHVMLERLLAVGFNNAWLATMVDRAAHDLKCRRGTMRLANVQAIAELYRSLRERVAALRILEDRLGPPDNHAGAPVAAA